MTILRDAAIVFLASFLAGALVAMALGEANRGTPVWHVSMTLAVAAFCIAAFFASAHMATGNRLVHVCVVALVGALPNLALFVFRADMTFLAFLFTIALLLLYAVIGAGLSYLVRRPSLSSAMPSSNTSLERTRDG
jgi:hypothetical protein